MTGELLDNIAEEFSLDRSGLSCALLGGGVARAPKYSKKVLFVFSDSKPCCIAKWYGEENKGLEIEVKQLSQLNQKFDRSPVQMGCFAIGNRTVAVESFLDGSSLEDLLCKKLITPANAIDHARDVFSALYEKTNLDSNSEALELELSSLLESIEDLSIDDADFFKDLLLNNSRAFYANGEARKSLVHFDFIPRNIILVDGEANLFDFEFTGLSHLAICDWFRFFMYSPGLMHRRAFAPGLVSEFIFDNELPVVFKTLAGNPKHFVAICLATYLIDFKLHRLISPDYAVDRLTVGLKQQLEAVKSVTQAL